MERSEYLKYDAVGLADLIRRKQVTAGDVMQCAVDLAQDYDNTYHFICHEQYEASLELAKSYQVREHFGGIPFLLKDSGLASVRFPSSLGSRLFENTTYAVNSTLVDRFEHAGLIPFARTRVSELCMAPTTEAFLNSSPTLNPWDVTRSAGGSSGGTGVAVSTGVVPVAHGSDGGGSVRIPAACCGVFGFKPSRTVLPVGPSRGESLAGMATDGVLSRTVRDSAALLDMIRGYEPGGPHASPVYRDSFWASTLPDLKRPFLRVGVLRDAWSGIPVAPECVDAVDYAVALCVSLGHDVVNIDLPALEYDKFVEAHCTVLATTIVLNADAKLSQLQRPLSDDDLEPAIHDGYHVGKSLAACDYANAVSVFHKVGRQIQTAMNGFDILLTPTLTQLPARLGAYQAVGDFRQFREKVAQYATFLAIINASGQPAASVPVYWTPEQLPVGVQLISHFGRDDLVFRLSAELERVAPWHSRIPVRSDDKYNKRGDSVHVL